MSSVPPRSRHQDDNRHSKNLLGKIPANDKGGVKEKKAFRVQQKSDSLKEN